MTAPRLEDLTSGTTRYDKRNTVFSKLEYSHHPPSLNQLLILLTGPKPSVTAQDAAVKARLSSFPCQTPSEEEGRAVWWGDAQIMLVPGPGARVRQPLYASCCTRHSASGCARLALRKTRSCWKATASRTLHWANPSSLQGAALR